MRSKIISACIFILFPLILTACKPAGYSEAKVKEVTEAHSGEARQWFADNLPAAKVSRTEAYADGVHLYSAITGEYSLEGGRYQFFYDYHNREMYLGKEYEEAAAHALKELAAELGVESGQMRFSPGGYSIITLSEDDRDPEEYSNASVGLIKIYDAEVLPAGCDPLDYGSRMIYQAPEEDREGGLSGSGAFVYVREFPFEVLPDELAGMAYLVFIKPSEVSFDGVYKVSCYPGWSRYDCMHLEKVSDKLSAGYAWSVKETFDEHGAVTASEPDIESRNDMDIRYEDGRLSFEIPMGAEPLVLAPKGKYAFDALDGSGKPLTIFWYEEKKMPKVDYLADRSLAYFSTMVFPDDGRNIYTLISGKGRTEFNFHKN